VGRVSIRLSLPVGSLTSPKSASLAAMPTGSEAQGKSGAHSVRSPDSVPIGSLNHCESGIVFV
jgi:hypothetical protein